MQPVWPGLKCLAKEVYVFVLGECRGDPLVEALRHGPLQGVLPEGSLVRVVRSAACTSASAAGGLVGVCVVALWRTPAGVSMVASALWWWTLGFVLLQAAVLPSRVAIVANLRDAVDLMRIADEPSPLVMQAGRTACTAGELMYGWLLVGVVARYHDTCTSYPQLRSLTGWVLLLTFTRSAAVDIYHFFTRPPQRAAAEEEDDLEAGNERAPKELIAQLPSVKHCCEEQCGCGRLNTGCAICLAEFEEGSTVLKLPCRHTFHRTCITKWLRRSKRCPLCMCPIDEV